MFFLRYIGACIYDLFILLVIGLALTAAILLYRRGHGIPQGVFWYQGLLWGSGFIYYYYSLAKAGQTLGMRAWRFKLVSLTAEPLSLSQIIKRLIFSVPALMLAPFYIKSHYPLNQWTQTTFVLTTKPLNDDE